MKRRVSPVLLVLFLIIIVAAAGILSMVIGRLKPSTERVSAAEYFGETAADEAILIVDREKKEEKVKIIDGRYYADVSAVGGYITGSFFWDQGQGVMLCMLPTEEFQIAPAAMEYQNSQGIQNAGYPIVKLVDSVPYIDLEFVKQFADMEYTIYEEPSRVVVQTTWQAETVVTATKNDELRQKGGPKSPIVKDLEKGEQLYLVEELENWSRVTTKDGYSGYVEKKSLSESETLMESHTSTAPEYTSQTRDYKINMAWHQVTNQEGNQALASALANTQGLNTISPTWFSVIDNNGTISSLASVDYVNQAHSMGLEVWGLIDNFSTEADTLTWLSNTQVRANIINQLMSYVDQTGMDGINLDFESITEEQSLYYIQFIRELSIACRNRQLVLSIDVPVPMPYTTHYNRKEQGLVADYIMIMGYDEHHSSSTEAGSVASLNFVRNGIADTLKEVPAEKVVNGIPFYTRVWTESFGAGGGLASEVLAMNATDEYIAQHGMETYWDEECGQTVASLETEDAIYTIWVEDEKSIEEKMKLVKEYQIAGVAEWKLGREKPEVWPVIMQYLQ